MFILHLAQILKLFYRFVYKRIGWDWEETFVSAFTVSRKVHPPPVPAGVRAVVTAHRVSSRVLDLSKGEGRPSAAILEIGSRGERRICRTRPQCSWFARPEVSYPRRCGNRCSLPGHESHHLPTRRPRKARTRAPAFPPSLALGAEAAGLHECPMAECF